MGRTRKPLSEQAGNLTKEIQARKTAEQELVKTSADYLSAPPYWLSQRAKNEYIRLYNAMKNMDMLGDLDANNLAAYCEAFDNYRIATDDIHDNGLCVWTDDSTKIANPNVALQIKFAKEMREFGKQCGLSIDSRLKFAANKLDEIENDINEEFGDI